MTGPKVFSDPLPQFALQRRVAPAGSCRRNALRSEHVASTLFISGCVANQGLFHSRFDAVVLLTAPLDVLLERVISRSTNPYGKTSAERAEIITYTGTIEPLLRAGATAQIDTAHVQPDEVADELERIAGVVTT